MHTCRSAKTAARMNSDEASIAVHADSVTAYEPHCCKNRKSVFLRRHIQTADGRFYVVVASASDRES